MKADLDKDIVILGSGELIRSLMPHGLIDEYRLSIYPLILGKGRRLFTTDGDYAALKLVTSTPTTTGVMIATYQPTDEKTLGHGWRPRMGSSARLEDEDGDEAGRGR